MEEKTNDNQINEINIELNTEIITENKKHINKRKKSFKNANKCTNKVENENKLDDYMKIINKKCEDKLCNYRKNKNSNMQINLSNINVNDEIYNLLNNKLNVSQLKNIAKQFKLKVSGNKLELMIRIFSFSYLSYFIIKIQRNFRRYLVEKYKRLHGPAFMKPELCVNNNDFISLEDLSSISPHQFISFKDNDNFIYGFSINSLYNLFFKNNLINSINRSNPNNPYNRNIIPNYVYKNIKSIIRLGKLFNIKININLDDEFKDLTEEKSLELKTLALFQNIDLLGNYSNPNWFLSLNWILLNKFIRELQDIWYYRAQLSNETKINICPPLGDPFKNLHAIHIANYENNNLNLLNAKKIVLECLEKLVNTGIDKDSKTLGAYYILGALTLVNDEAALALPWLYQSFTLIQF